MAKPIAIKDVRREQALFRTRAAAAMVGVAIMVAILLFRVVKLQIVEHDHYTTLSRDNQVKITAIPPSRGLIFDRNGVVLAQNLPSFSLEITPEQVDDIPATLDALAEFISISAYDRKRFDRALKRKRRFESVPVRINLNDEEVARFAVNRYRFPGVDIEARLRRSYPLGKLSVHTVGYVGRINEAELETLDTSSYAGISHIGKTGIERAYESILHGQVGHQQVETNAQGRVLRVLERTSPVPGRNLHLNIDIGLHAVIEKAMGDRNGAVVAIDPDDGAVLAFISLPGFDPNAFVSGIDTASYKALTSSRRRPLFNRALRGQYPPGSTVKPFFGLAGLHHHLRVGSQQTWCPGWYQLTKEGRRYRDWKKRGHGHTSLRKAIVESCDVYFYELAHDMGIDRMHDFLASFGFGRLTGIDVHGEASGLMPSTEWKRRVRNQSWFPGETLITGIGQGFMLATPLQLAVATAALSRRGQVMRPQLVHATRGVNDTKPQLMLPRPAGKTTPVSSDSWRYIIDSMIGVVNSPVGTARKVGIDAPALIAGKTGTSQVFTIKQDEEYEEADVAKELRDHGLFISFAPADDAEIALAVIVEHGGGGSRAAAPVARKIMDHFFESQRESEGG